MTPPRQEGLGGKDGLSGAWSPTFSPPPDSRFLHVAATGNALSAFEPRPSRE